MSTLAEIEAAVPKLSPEELAELEKFVQLERKKAGVSTGHSVLDIPTANVGRMLRPFPAEDDDLLEEMLDGRA
jgi:hypothetical protein